MPTVLITAGDLYQKPGRYSEILQEAGFEIRYPAEPPDYDQEGLIRDLQGVSATLAGPEAYTDAVYRAAPELRVVSRMGVGVDRVNVDLATGHKVLVAITPRGNFEAVAEHAMALLLGVAKRVAELDRQVRQGNWPRAPVFALRGKTLGLMGLGRIGRAVAQRAAPFHMKLLAWDVQPDHDFAQAHGIELTDLDSLLARSDMISLHVPLGDETRGIINRRTLAQMKKGSFLVNTSRGGLVVEKDLVDALRSGHLAGAGLDVFENEPLPVDDALLEFDSVIAAPHIAGTDETSYVESSAAAAQNIVDLYDGKWPDGSIVNPQLRSGWKWS